MADNTTLNAGVGGDVIATDDIAGVKHQRVKLEFGVNGAASDVSPSNPLPVSLEASNTSDVHGQLVGVTRITQITTKFFQQAPSNFLNITASGGATATGPTAGAAVFATGTATTASLQAQTPTSILYTSQYEAWAVLSGAFTTPTSAASFQRLGIYDAVNGYFFGYNGTTFGLTVRANSVDTFIAQAAWNRDPLTGGAESLFTSNESPVVLAPTNLNMYRMRYGWYGGVTALYEVYAPDGNWVVVHQSRTINSQTGVNMTAPDLPMTLEVSKTAADATDLRITCGGWAAGITAPSSGPSLSGRSSLAALNTAVTVPLTGIGALSFSVTGTWVGTLSPQYSLDGLAWTADTPLNNVTGGLVATTTVNGAFTSAVASYKFYRIIATAWTSGTASIVYNGSASSNFVVSQSLITDGLGAGPVAVKAASTPAVAADPSLVVALSPSSPLPGLAPTTLWVTATAATGAAATATLPAAGAGLFHYVTSIDIQLYATAARTGSATPVLVTTTNLPGAPVYNFTTAQAIGAIERYAAPLLTAVKSSVANTATTIAAPIATTGLWRINVGYYAAP